MSARWAAAVLMTVIALTSCGVGENLAEPSPSPSSSSASPSREPSTPDETPSASASASPSGTPDADEFLAVVRKQLPDVSSGRSDAEITAVAQLACQALAAGATADQLVAAVQSLGTLDAEATDQATARELVELAIDTTCPDQAGRVDEF